MTNILSVYDWLNTFLLAITVGAGEKHRTSASWLVQVATYLDKSGHGTHIMNYQELYDGENKVGMS